MATALWLALGGALGTLARFGVSGAFNAQSHPWGTVTVNVVGSLVLGVAVGLWGVEHDADYQLALSIGVLGGFTTFSTFALDTIRLWEEGQPGTAVFSVVASIVLGIGAALVGLAVGRAMAR